MTIKLKIKSALFLAACICAANTVHADDAASIPLQPKVTKINYVVPAFFSVNEPSITMMADDPEVIKQVKRAVGIKNNYKSKALGKIKKTVSVNSSQASQDVETINLPISELSAKVTNTGASFVFVDVTNRDTSSSSSSRLTLPLELRRLQVEAARQVASKEKRR